MGEETPSIIFLHSWFDRDNDIDQLAILKKRIKELEDKE
jgi:hypothetical protein